MTDTDVLYWENRQYSATIQSLQPLRALAHKQEILVPEKVHTVTAQNMYEINPACIHYRVEVEDVSRNVAFKNNNRSAPL